MTVRENLFNIKERISSVCSRINRDPSSITIVAVSKGRPVEQIKEAIAAGISDIGENRVQEALTKHSDLGAMSYELRPIRWHLVGHLQTNKVKEAVRIFDLIHSVDSAHLAREIDKQAGKINKIQEVLVEIKTSPEATKFGISPEEAIDTVKEMAKLKNISIKGLMTIAPLADNPEKSRPYFRILKQLRDKINGLSTISMGMTDDFEIAIEEGATMVRIGRAIFQS